MTTVEITISISSVVAIEAFRDEFGDFGRVTDGTGEWTEWLVYPWPSHRMYLIVSKDESNRTIHCHYRGRGTGNRVKKVKGLLEGEDLWLVRKVLSSYLDPNRASKRKESFRNRLLTIGLVLTCINITLTIIGFAMVSWLLQIIGLYLELINLIGLSIVWLVYRLGISDNAVDIRMFSMAFLYTFLLHGVPFSLLAAFLGLLIPVQGDLAWFIFPVAFALILSSSIWVKYGLDSRLQEMLRREWDEMRVNIQRRSETESYEQTPLETNLWAAAFISYPRALSPSSWFVAITLFSVWVFRFLGDSWFIALFAIPCYLLWFSISWDYGLIFGMKVAAKKLKETGPYMIKIGEHEVMVSFGIPPPKDFESL